MLETMDLGFTFESASQTSMSYMASVAASAAASAASIVSFETLLEGFPETELPVWILGRSYSAIHGKAPYKLYICRDCCEFKLLEYWHQYELAKQ